jgi:hypothetical protein
MSHDAPKVTSVSNKISLHVAFCFTKIAIVCSSGEGCYAARWPVEEIPGSGC